MTDDPSTLPPRWAESLLRTMLRPQDRDSISGDLLEEFRESIIPAHGAGANAWYIRQVGGYVLRETWIWSTLVASIFIGRGLVDTLAPIHYTPGVIATRSAIMSWALIATFVLCTAWHAWRTRRIGSAMLLVAVAAVAGGILTTAGSLVSLAIWHDPDTLRAIATSGGLEEMLVGPMIGGLVYGLVTGLPGAIAGRLAAAICGSSSTSTKSV